jgi:Tfp pilus assembly protein PilV
MRCNKGDFKSKGFSLIEVVASLGVLTIGILSILSLFAMSMQASKRAGYYSAGTFLLQQLAEEEKRKGYDASAVPAWTPLQYDNKIPFEYQILTSAQALYVQKTVSVRWNEGFNVAGASKKMQVSAKLFILRN